MESWPIFLSADFIIQGRTRSVFLDGKIGRYFLNTKLSLVYRHVDKLIELDKYFV